MYNKKRVSILLVLVVISIIGISIVSAGWFSDLFKIGNKSDEGLEGELPASAPASVTVNPPAVPPIVWYVSGLNGTGGGASPLIANSFVIFKFDFYACSIGGELQLPDASEASRILGAINGSYGGSARTDQAFNCRYNGQGAFPGQPGAGICAGLSKNYSCDVIIYYFYDYQTSTGATIYWGINASVVDDAGRMSSNLTKTFVVAQLKSWDQTPLYINWTGVQAGATNSLASNQVKIINTGNADIGNVITPITWNLNITGTNLMRGGGIENITANEFRVAVYTGTPCTTGNTLNTGVEVPIAPFSVLHTASTTTVPASNNLSFCIPGPLAKSAGLYETGPTQAERWNFKTF